MKEKISIFCCLLLMACSRDRVNNNQYLPDVNFSIDINTSLPGYNSLQSPGNPVLITNAGVGVQGIIVMRTGLGNSFVAWEASCPIQYPVSCSRLGISGNNANCSCENHSYNLYTGDGGQQYPLKAYRVEVNGSVVRVYN